jgi:hypothetical protein
VLCRRLWLLLRRVSAHRGLTPQAAEARLCRAFPWALYALESHYYGQLKRHYREEGGLEPENTPSDILSTDPPF